MLLENRDLTEKIIGAAIEVHKVLGPGMLESAYEECLAYELNSKGLQVRRQLNLPIEYKEISLECAYRIDILVEEKVIVELKSIESLASIHIAQMLTYMRFAQIRTGLLINFNVTKLKDGIRRFIL